MGLRLRSVYIYAGPLHSRKPTNTRIHSGALSKPGRSFLTMNPGVVTSVFIQGASSAMLTYDKLLSSALASHRKQNSFEVGVACKRNVRSFPVPLQLHTTKSIVVWSCQGLSCHPLLLRRQRLSLGISLGIEALERNIAAP